LKLRKKEDQEENNEDIVIKLDPAFSCPYLSVGISLENLTQKLDTKIRLIGTA